MGMYKDLVIEAEDCGLKGMNSADTCLYLKEKFPFTKFDEKIFEFGGYIHLAWTEAYIEFRSNNDY